MTDRIIFLRVFRVLRGVDVLKMWVMWVRIRTEGARCHACYHPRG
ncbi:MAG: hypothetical protein JETT_1243 [Candidatus Jettenia ecosi]|uniref:Uncharacterized protein n=1 Tax=Candidatus Jettenia ecosi TaxID=2494326 RepID=A0A533QCH1_9BACT|nr:MAG: hypothetical protein JETT_1243 [Candidatus Jettenia ecosi]